SVLSLQSGGSGMEPARYSVPENSLKGFWNAYIVPKNNSAPPARKNQNLMPYTDAPAEMVRFTTALVIGGLDLFLASGCGPSMDASPARAARSGVTRWPASIASTFGSLHGMGATPPRSTRARLHTSRSISSTTATLTIACVQDSRSSSL